MGEIFSGNEALGAGMPRHVLRRWYRPLFRGVYIPKNATPTLQDRAFGAWLTTDRTGVIGGLAASALHGAADVDDWEPIEIFIEERRKQSGLIVRMDRLSDDEVMNIDELLVTTPARTAFDLGRYQRRYAAIARLDALMAAAPFTERDVIDLTYRYGPVRGVRQLRDLLPLVDAKSQSLKESWLRLLVIDRGFPKPETQIEIGDGEAFLDMGWRHIKLALEYDGDGHRTDRGQYVKDLRRIPMIEKRGWELIRVIKEDSQADVIERVTEAFVRRGGPEIYEMVESTRTLTPVRSSRRRWAA